MQRTLEENTIRILQLNLNANWSKLLVLKLKVLQSTISSFLSAAVAINIHFWWNAFVSPLMCRDVLSISQIYQIGIQLSQIWLEILVSTKFILNDMESARTQLGEVMGLMRGNLVKMEERGEKLSDMEKRAEKLQAESEKFAVFLYIFLLTFFQLFIF